jgi:Ca2+-binding EF-hand superfamily protein
MKRVALTLVVMALAYLVAQQVATAADEKKADKPKPSAEEQFAKLDVNKDGKVTKDEFVAGHSRMAKDKAEAIFAKIAKNKDSFTLDDFKAALAKKKGDRDKKK